MDYKGVDNLELMLVAKNYNRFLVNMAVSEIKKHNARKIIDFGSGIGFFATKITQEAGLRNIDCIEMADNLQQYYENNDKLVLHKKLNDLPDGQVDLIYSYNVLEHIEDDISIIKSFHAKLKQGGMILLYLPAFPCLYTSMDKKVGHFRRYKKHDLTAKLQLSGFDIYKCSYVDFSGFFVTLLYKFLGSKHGSINLSALKFFDKFIFPISRLFDIITGGRLLGKNIMCIAIKK